MSRSNDQLKDGLLTLTRSDDGSQVCLALTGELDLSNMGILETSLAEAIDSGKKVLIDLGELEFLDSTALALIVKTLSRSDAERFSFVPSKSSSVRRVLNLTGLDERMVVSSPVETRQSLPTV